MSIKSENNKESTVFLNREISWLEFNERVLHQALSDTHPLLERLHFYSIFTSNMDEFHMKRVGRLQGNIERGHSQYSIDGLSSTEQLSLIREKFLKHIKLLGHFDTHFIKYLRDEKIFLTKHIDLNDNQKKFCNQYFDQNLFPVLTPLAVDRGHPFPFLSNLSKSIGVRLKRTQSSTSYFARVKIPSGITQWLRVPTKDKDEFRFVSTSSIILENLPKLFPKMIIEEASLFKIIRSAEWDDENFEADDIKEMVEVGLKVQKFNPVLRLDIRKDTSNWIKNFIMEELELSEDQVYEINSITNYSTFYEILDIDRPDLKFPPFRPVVPPEHKRIDNNIFQIIRKKDQLYHHPFESFSATVEKFIHEAAIDPNVLAIKMTLYRTGNNSQIVDSLIRAAESGKQVACLIELKARFEEERNIRIAKKMEKAGVHVIFGIDGLKIHCKTTLVVRNDHDGINCYCHFGTGNYNPSTAKLYTDYSLLTTRKELTSETIELFNYLTGRSLKKDYKTLLVAPINLKHKFIKMIAREIENHKKGRPSRIIAKMNSLEDVDIIEWLYRASTVGVKIDLIVRGFCCLRPGIKGLSDNIRVISIIGRFLEHSRVFYFQNGAKSKEEGEFYIGSADWMHRNLHNRVEIIVPIDNLAIKREIWANLKSCLKDNWGSWELKNNGQYKKLSAKQKEKTISSQELSLRKAEKQHS